MAAPVLGRWTITIDAKPITIPPQARPDSPQTENEKEIVFCSDAQMQLITRLPCYSTAHPSTTSIHPPSIHPNPRINPHTGDRLDVQLCLSPVTTLSIPLDRVSRSTISSVPSNTQRSAGTAVVGGDAGSDFQQTQLQRTTRDTRETRERVDYRRRIHCGTGRFCRAAFASLTFVRNDLCDGIVACVW